MTGTYGRMAMVLVAAAIAFAPATGQASMTGGLRGRVVDGTTGGPILGAAVEIKSEDFDKFVTANRNGFFSVLGLQPGRYWVISDTQGMTCSIDVLYVDAGETRNVNIAVQPSSGPTNCDVMHHSHVADPDRTQDETTIW